MALMYSGFYGATQKQHLILNRQTYFLLLFGNFTLYKLILIQYLNARKEEKEKVYETLKK
jgi:uncharacterized membrane protein